MFLLSLKIDKLTKRLKNDIRDECVMTDKKIYVTEGKPVNDRRILLVEAIKWKQTDYFSWLRPSTPLANAWQYIWKKNKNKIKINVCIFFFIFVTTEIERGMPYRRIDSPPWYYSCNISGTCRTFITTVRSLGLQRDWKDEEMDQNPHQCDFTGDCGDCHRTPDRTARRKRIKHNDWGGHNSRTQPHQ